MSSPHQPFDPKVFVTGAGTRETVHMDATLFPQELIDLQRELLHPFHRPMFDRISQRPRPFDEVMTDLCTECEIVVEGVYSPEDQLGLCRKIVEILIDRRQRAVAMVVKRD